MFMIRFDSFGLQNQYSLVHLQQTSRRNATFVQYYALHVSETELSPGSMHSSQGFVIERQQSDRVQAARGVSQGSVDRWSCSFLHYTLSSRGIELLMTL